MYSQYMINTYKRVDLLIENGHGSWLVDVAGNEYLDFVSGIAVNSLGHNHPRVVETLKNQASKLLHVSNLYWTKEQGELGKKLVELSDHEAVFFCNSGSEAVEGALKTSRKYGKTKSPSKHKILCFNQSFHGRTMGALSVTAQKKYQEQFEPLMDDVLICEFNNIDDVKSKITEDVCAIIVEPIQGEGGIIPAQYDFLKGLKSLCIENDALLIFDEVQCGVGRMGTFYAYTSFDVVPDIVCMAKGLGGGVPIGAFVVNDKANIMTYGDHGSTYGGNSLVCAVSKSVVDVISEPSFLEAVKKKSDYLKHKLINMKDMHPVIKDIRGEGLMLGMELLIPQNEIIEKALTNKLLLIGAGEKIIRFVPPLTISYDEIDLFLETFEKVLKQITVS